MGAVVDVIAESHFRRHRRTGQIFLSHVQHCRMKIWYNVGVKTKNGQNFNLN